MTMSDDQRVPSSQACRTYAVGDVHGRLDLLRSAVNAIAEHAEGSDFRLVFLGDYVDRGPDACGVIDFLMELQTRWPVICLKGNHEDLMSRAIGEPNGTAMARWLEYGGDATLLSYGVKPGDDPRGAIPREHLQWISSLPRTTGDDHRIYVHAGLLPRLPAHRQKDETFLWIRERFLNARPSEFEAHIVHGHTPVWEGKLDPAEPELLNHRTNIDTAAFATGVLIVAVFDGRIPGGPQELLRIKGDEAPYPALDDAAEEFAARPAKSGSNWRRRLGRLYRSMSLQS